MSIISANTEGNKSFVRTKIRWEISALSYQGKTRKHEIEPDIDQRCDSNI